MVSLVAVIWLAAQKWQWGRLLRTVLTLKSSGMTTHVSLGTVSPQQGMFIVDEKVGKGEFQILSCRSRASSKS